MSRSAKLNYRYLNCKTVSYNWYDGDNPDNWDVVYPSVTDATINKWAAKYGVACEDVCVDDVQDAMGQDDAFYPMMSCYINLNEDIYEAQEIADKVEDTCFTCIIVDGDKVCLSLVGGGMDMTWDIVRAFIKLGSVPPVDYCDLPGMAGEHDAKVIDACNEALSGMIEKHTQMVKYNNDRR